jgi:hypothetical protein
MAASSPERRARGPEDWPAHSPGSWRVSGCEHTGLPVSGTCALSPAGRRGFRSFALERHARFHHTGTNACCDRCLSHQAVGDKRDQPIPHWLGLWKGTNWPVVPMAEKVKSLFTRRLMAERRPAYLCRRSCMRSSQGGRLGRRLCPRLQHQPSISWDSNGME